MYGEIIVTERKDGCLEREKAFANEPLGVRMTVQTFVRETCFSSCTNF